MYYYVYITTNLINGKKYIGQHVSESLNNSYIGSGKLLKKAIKKYGKENFICEIIAFANNKDELNTLEIEEIKKHDAVKSDMFYNITEGGEGTLGRKWTEDDKKKISDTKKRKYATGETKPAEWDQNRRKHISELMKEQYKNGIRKPIAKKGKDSYSYGRKGPLSPKYGTHMSEESKEKLRNTIKQQYENGRIPSRKGKKDSPEIIQQKRERGKKLVGELNPNYGNKWGEESRKKMSKTCKTTKCHAGSHNAKAISVRCLETGIEYECMKYAALEYGCDRHYISLCCKGKRETAGGVHWEYASQANTVPSSQEIA